MKGLGIIFGSSFSYLGTCILCGERFGSADLDQFDSSVCVAYYKVFSQEKMRLFEEYRLKSTFRADLGIAEFKRR